jgi:hypothetical protein
MDKSFAWTIRVIIGAAVVAIGVGNMYRRSHQATKPVTPPVASAATKRDTSAVRSAPPVTPNTIGEFGDTASARRRADEDAAFDKANGRGLTTKQTYVAPLTPEPPRTGSPPA